MAETPIDEERIREQLGICAITHNWDDAQKEAAEKFMTALISVERPEVLSGADIAAINRIVATAKANAARGIKPGRPYLND